MSYKNLGKIGFACKWIDTKEQVNGLSANDDAKNYTTGTTTISWLNRQTRNVAEQKLWDLVNHNMQNTLNLVNRVGALPVGRRMVRLSSDILPAYSHRDWNYFYQRPDVIDLVSAGLARVGDAARAAGVRLSFHPGQFCVLASASQNIIEASIEEFEYHADMARWMGYGKSFQDFKINVHISGKQGPDGIRASYKRLSQVAQNCITIENEENAWGLEDALQLGDILPIVLDVHHHWCREGEWLKPTSDLVKRVIDSWRGVQPVMHYSVSREDYLVEHDSDVKPNYAELLETGYKKAKLRAHSDFYWNTDVNLWVLQYLHTHDIMCESKGKNLASAELYELAQQISL